MEPLHMTEFGSDRYLEKFNQSQANSAPPTAPTPGLLQSPFILPLRGSTLTEAEAPPAKSGDQKRPEKRGFGFFKNKFHAKGSSAAPSSIEHPEQRPPSTQSTTARKR
jgi:hypothetical protein